MRRCLVLISALVAVERPAAENLFPAGSFELLRTNGLPAGWSRMPNQRELNGSLAEFTVESEGTNHFIRFRDNAPAMDQRSQAGLFLDGDLPLRPEWKRLAISARMRALVTGIGTQDWQAARTIVYFHAANGRIVYPTNRLPMVKDMCAWTSQFMVVDIPAGATNLCLRPGLWGCTGYACFDDITVSLP